jgi:Spy/CpxP family protein refolding chaperone
MMIKRITLIAVLAMLAFSTAAWSNPHERGHGSRGDSMFGNTMKMVHRLERAADKIGISDQQMDEIMAVVDESRQSVREVRRAMRDNRKAIAESIHADNYDADQVQKLADQHGQLASQMIVMGAQVRSQVHALLTEEQRQQIGEMKSRKKRGRH